MIVRHTMKSASRHLITMVAAFIIQLCSMTGALHKVSFYRDFHWTSITLAPWCGISPDKPFSKGLCGNLSIWSTTARAYQTKRVSLVVLQYTSIVNFCGLPHHKRCEAMGRKRFTSAILIPEEHITDEVRNSAGIWDNSVLKDCSMLLLHGADQPLSLHSELLLCAIPGHHSALCHSLLNASVEPRTPITLYGKQLRMYQAFDIKVQSVLPENQGGVFAFLQWLPSDFCALFGGTVEQGVMQTSVNYILLGVYRKIPPASSVLCMLTDTSDGMVIKDKLLLLKHNIALPLWTPTLPGYCFSNFIAPTAVYNSVGTDAENILGDKQFLFYSLQRPFHSWH